MTSASLDFLRFLCALGHPVPVRPLRGDVVDELSRAGLVRREAGVVFATVAGRVEAQRLEGV